MSGARAAVQFHTAMHPLFAVTSSDTFQNIEKDTFDLRSRNGPALHEPQEVLGVVLEDQSGVGSVIVDWQADIGTE